MSNSSQSQPQSTTLSAGSQRSVTGVVTKLVGDGQTFGFISNEIFFPQTCVADGPALVGDQVFAECEYSPAMPIKWNASSVKILQRSGENAPRNDDPSRAVSSTQLSSQPNVAMTYQQHRQQKQQTLLPKDGLIGQSDQLPAQPDFYQSANQVNSVEMDSQQFNPNRPMGPPNLSFTSQLGSAFVQSQFPAASPFMAQQPPPPLITQKKPILPSYGVQGQQQRHNSNNTNNNNNNKNNRFNNFQDKNNEIRQNNQNRRNHDRNDGKFGRDNNKGRDSHDRDNSANRQRGNRERSQGGGNRREDSVTRVSPQPSHVSSRSSIERQSRRRYDIQNIPKMRILTNMNPQNMKLRCPTSLHIPSDLREIFINQHFRLDIKNTPKPLKYTIEQTKSSGEVQATKEQTTTKSTSPNTQDETSTDELNASIEKPTPPSSKSDMRLNHKYGVKVILISIPEMDTIYQRIFGQDLNSFNHDVKLCNEKLDECISLLCGKGTNNGRSLIGGKFDPVLDGFIEGGSNIHERNGRQPDLIATCKRLVLDQSGLDLTGCKTWSLVSTLVYNNKSDYFSPKASAEYSYVYLPHIWTIMSESFEKKIIKEESLGPDVSNECNESQETSNETLPNQKEQKIGSSNESEDIAMAEDTCPNDVDVNIGVELTAVASGNLSDMKVVDLKAELDRRGIKYKNTTKKAELVTMLQASIQSASDLPNAVVSTVQSELIETDNVALSDDNNETKPDTAITPDQGLGNDQVCSDEVETNSSQMVTQETITSRDDPPSLDSDKDTNIDESSRQKRKFSFDNDGQHDEQATSTKKLCPESIKEWQEKGRVEIICDPFVVRSKGDQQFDLVSLSEASSANRHDQFELSVASNILRESLIQHLSEYMLTALIEDFRSRSSSSALSSSSQDLTTTTSDSNNNNKQSSSKATAGQSDSGKSLSATNNNGINTKEQPVNRYINIAFSFFDASHIGFIYTEDLAKLFANTSLALSKRELSALLSDSDRFNYRFLADLHPSHPAGQVFSPPVQFSEFPGSSGLMATRGRGSSSNQRLTAPSCGTVDFEGVTYDVERLVRQVSEAERLRLSLVDRFNFAIENYDKQADEIKALEASQRSLASAIKAQEELKRERDQVKKKFEALRKRIKASVGELLNLIKDEQEV